MGKQITEFYKFPIYLFIHALTYHILSQKHFYKKKILQIRAEPKCFITDKNGL